MIDRNSAGKVSFAASQYSKEKEYWLNKFQGELRKSHFPYDYFPKGKDKEEEENEQQKEKEIVTFNFSREISSELIKLSKNLDHRLYMILAAGLVALLYKYTGNDDIIIGSPIFKQAREGNYINTVLPLRIEVDEGINFKELLLHIVRPAVTGATEHQNYPIETLLFQLHMPMIGKEFPLFDAVILLENIQEKKYIEHVYPNFIFSFLRTDEGDINAELEYNACLYKAGTAVRIATHFKNLIEKAIMALDTLLSKIDILSDAEKEQQLMIFNGPQTEYPWDRSIDSLFAEQVSCAPDMIALAYDTYFITYSRLNEMANILASYLRLNGLRYGDLVTVMVENSPQAIISLLAILKAGGAYLPLNTEYPVERKKYMIADSQVKLLLTNCKDEAIMFQPGLTLIDLQDHAIYEHKNTFAGFAVNPDSQGDGLAYIMYTSGSTGAPKGVMVKHRNVIRLVRNTNFFQFKKDDRLLLTGALEFDASTFETWGPLLNGLPLHMVNKDTILSPDKLKEAIQKNNINLMWLTSPLFNQLLDTDMEIFAGIRNLLVGGDVLSPSHIYRAKKRFPHLNIINGYGPTENTTFSTTYLIEDEYRENIPIGKPLANSTAYILDASYNLVPIGAPGELYVGGDGLSLGYLNRPELTAEKFDQDLWDVCDNQDKRNKSFFGWARGAVFSKKAPLFYKTGDLARLLSDGNIEFLGRLDYQVKIRGYRIEPGEIEKHLKQFHFISEAVVIDRKNKDDEKYLCAYLVLAEEEKEKFDAVELRKKLSLNLPDYMVPSHFVRLEKIPLNINGKVDKKALPEPEITLGDTVYIGPRNLVEEKFIEIWSEVLRIEKEKISIDSNFFELGGHSLKATIVISKLNKTFDIKIPLAELFKIPTIRELAEFIKKLKKDAFASIKEAEEKEYYELSAAQKRHYFLHQLEQDNIIYNVPFKTILKGKSNPDHIEQIFKKLIKRHESLRTSFQMLNNKPVQRISKDVEFQIEVLEITKQKPDLLTGLMQNFIRSFDLSRAPLMRVGILPKKEEEFILIVDMHHIITDGTSISLLVDEFIQLYKGLELPILKLQYKDYAEWQNSEPEKEKRQKQEKYWLQEFKKEISTLELPIDYPRPLTQNFDGDSFPFEISPDHAGALNSLVMTENSTLFMILLAIYYILLAKLSGQEDIIIGTPIAGRRHADLEKIVGMFVNSLGLRNFPNGNKTFREFLNEVRKKTLEAFENQDYQFENLVELVLVNRDFSRNPIFDVMFIFQNFTVSSGDFQDMVENAARKTNLAADELDDFIKISKFDLSLTVQEKDKKSFFSWQYCTKLFKKETVERFTMYFKKIISIILKDPNIKICDIEIISEKEKKEVIYTFNSSDTIYPGNKMIHQLFDEQVAHAPGRVALYGVYEANKFNKTHLTYLELQKSSASLAQSLSKRGVSHDTIVGIMAERTVEVIIGILGILKSGGAYLPIDPEYPQERIEYMLKDSNAILLAVAIGLEGEKVRRCEGKKVSSSNLAYVIYTSGSTGRPKAVMVEHRNVVRLVKNTNYVEFKENGHLLQTGALEFDASTFEIWGSLLNGMTLYTAPKDEILNPAKLRAYARKWDIVTMWLTSPLFNQLAGEDVEIFAGLKNLLVGGDVLSPLYINRVRERFPGLNIINGYGPTENTTFSTTFKIDKEYIQRIPIGKPIANSTAFIVDKSNHLVPVGVCGELLVGGDGVSRGYLNNPELTAEKFDQDKINKSFFGGARGAIFSKKAPLIYRTGDLARWLVDGNIEFLGRIDQQVKMRGFRIELEEIESRLIKHPQIKEAAVLLTEDDNKDKYLVAYFAATISEKPIATAELKQYLSRQLPDYMVPSFFMQIEKIPLNVNGKIDRKALPKPMLKTADGQQVPRNEIEKKLAAIWTEILKFPQDVVGIESNFFEMGGQSLKAAIMTARIHKVFDVKMPVVELFKNPTIRKLAGYIKTLVKEQYISINPAEKKEYYSLSAAQKRLYILQQMDPGSTAYNIPQAFSIAGQADMIKLENVFNLLIQRHESLRTSFQMIENEPVQQVHEKALFHIEQFEDKEDLKTSFIRSFDLSQAPLMRVGLIKKTEAEYIMIVDIHHIISDGVSQAVLAGDFFALYAGKKLELLRIQYKDFSEWQNSTYEKEKIKIQQNYWFEELSGEIPVLALPNDYARPIIQSFEGESFGFELLETETAALKQLAVSGGVTLYMVLLGVYYVFLSRLTGQEDIIVGTPIAGRRHADLEKVIGMFVNTLAMRNFPLAHKEFAGFLTEVGIRTLEAFENQEYQFEDLVEKVLVNRDAGHNPIFDTLFTLQNFDNQTKETSTQEIEIKIYPFEVGIAKFDLSLTFVENRDKLVASFDYCTKLFKRETIKRFSLYFKQVVSTIIADQHKQISEVEIITPEEKQQIIYEFNDTTTGYPTGKSIDKLFDEQVAHASNRVALHGCMIAWMDGEVGADEGGEEKKRRREEEKRIQQITYGELNEQSDHLAALLIEKGVLPDMIVAIMMERSINLIIGILGILKSGGAYLPIDPEYPQERIEYMLKDSNAILLAVANGLEGEKVRRCEGKKVSSSNLAYVIYTSGSTGRPKAVMVEHRNVVRLVKNTNYVEFKENDRLLQTGALEFDASTFEIWGSLLNGMTLYTAAKDEILNPSKLKEYTRKWDIVTMWLTSPLFNQLAGEDVEIFAGLKNLLVGGDVLSPLYINRLRERFPGLNIINGYGPTENTTFSTTFKIDNEYTQRIPIGKPIANSTAFIVDKSNHLVPVGVCGELLLGGDGVSRGYLNNPELTNDRFILPSGTSATRGTFEKAPLDPPKLLLNYHSPFTTHLSPIYRTGDLARWLVDGNIEFLGRIDQQVKMRGFRIELEEIETRLSKHAHIKEVKVLDRTDANGDKYLCAYVVPGQDISTDELKKYLGDHLPEYMIPTYFVFVTGIPLNPNGKVDRNALPVPELEMASKENHMAPTNEIEEKIAAIWSEVLMTDKSKISINANFFSLGGHSLKAVVMIAKIQKEFDLKLELMQVFQTPTIKGIAALIEALEWVNPGKNPGSNPNEQEYEEVIL